MPAALTRSCSIFGCGRPVPCPVHHPARQHDRWRGTPAQRGYDSTWRRRALAFLREYPLCGMRPGHRPPVMSECHAKGLLTAAVQVDHVIPHRGNSALFNDREGNWQALCRACGARKSQAGQ